MSITDIVLVVVAILAGLGGWRRGALVGVLGLAGFVLGIWIGGLVLPPFSRWAHDQGLLSDRWRPLVALVVLLVFGFVVQTVFSMIAIRIRRTMGHGTVRGLDSLGGAVTSIVAAGLVVWLAAGFIRTTPFVAPNSWVASSRAVAGIDRIMPVTSGQALGQLGDFLTANGFPRVFSGQPEQIRSIGAPDRSVVDGVKGASSGIVKVLTDSDQCEGGSEGSGWVMAAGEVVTNAHVVAGADRVVVQAGGVGQARSAEVVAYDPARDVAVLRVPGLRATVLPQSRGVLSAGDSTVVAGFPENGGYTLAPSRVRQVMEARGLDIYGDKTVVRQIYSLRGIIRPGNSGGPLLNPRGQVVGVVFAKSTADDDTGYALTLDEVAPVLRKAGSSPVATGSCVA